MCCRGVVGECIQVYRRWWERPEQEGFQAGTVSSRAVSAGANGKVHTAEVQDTGTSKEVRCRTRRMV